MRLGAQEFRAIKQYFRLFFDSSQYTRHHAHDPFQMEEGGSANQRSHHRWPFGNIYMPSRIGMRCMVGRLFFDGRHRVVGAGTGVATVGVHIVCEQSTSIRKYQVRVYQPRDEVSPPC